MNKSLSFILIICLFGSCNYKLLVDKGRIIEERKGYLVFFHNDIVFFESKDTLDVKFMDVSHTNGFRIEWQNTEWLKKLSHKAPIINDIKGSNEKAFISLIPVMIRYYLGDTWQKVSEKNVIYYGFDKKMKGMIYKVHDYRRILLISVLRKTDVERISPLTDWKLHN